MCAYNMALVDVLLLLFITSSGLALNMADAFDVIQYGAIGDGIHDDSQAFLKAWVDVCGASGGIPTLSVPGGKTFFISPLAFIGPCKSNVIRVQIDGTLVAPSSRDAWKNCYMNSWITFRKVDGLYIQGHGTLDARGSSWWDPLSNPPNGACHKPTTFRLRNCKNSVVSEVHFLNSGRNHISISNCEALHIHNIVVTAPEDSPNTDGIDIGSSSMITISDSQIGTGDDCIAINSNCFNINITGLTCGPGHGISVGSLGKDGENAAIDGIRVENSTFKGTLATARIKTFPGGSGYARNIYYQHLILENVKSAIEINQHYMNNPEQPKAVQISNVHFIDVRGTGSQILVDCSEHVPCQQIYLQDVDIAPSTGGKSVDLTCNHANMSVLTVTPPLSCTN